MNSIITTIAAVEIERRKNECNGASCTNIIPEAAANQAQVTTGLGLVFGAFAAIAIVVIIISAINFVTSEGNPEKISKAKRGIIYALLGLVISLSAEAIVLLVVGRLG